MGIIAFCNQPEDHLILGELCLRLARRFEGVVSFGGALWPGLPPDLELGFANADWRQVEPYFRRMVADMPGHVVGIRYEPQMGREWVSHFGDAAFLEAWLKHPRFRMIK